RHFPDRSRMAPPEQDGNLRRRLTHASALTEPADAGREHARPPRGFSILAATRGSLVYLGAAPRPRRLPLPSAAGRTGAPRDARGAEPARHHPGRVRDRDGHDEGGRVTARRSSSAAGRPRCRADTLSALMRAGDTINNRFTIEHVAGEGGMGTVYRAR